MAANKQDFLVQGKNISENLGKIGQQIRFNRLNHERNLILSKYNNPDKLLFDNNGQPKSPTEVAANLVPDLTWLSGNGFIGEANTLGQMFAAYNQNLNQQQTNQSFLGLLSDDTRRKLGSVDLQRTNLPLLYNAVTRNQQTQIDPNKRNRSPFARDLGDSVLLMKYNVDTQQWEQEIIPKSDDWNVNYNNNKSNTSSYSVPEQKAFIVNGKVVYLNPKQSIPKGAVSVDDYLDFQENKRKQKQSDEE